MTLPATANLPVVTTMSQFRNTSQPRKISPRQRPRKSARGLGIAACFLLVLLLSGLTDARAADPGFCRQYAKAALGQVRAALADPRCGADVQGVGWSTDFSVHYEWCLGASLDTAGAERDARTRYLRACASR